MEVKGALASGGPHEGQKFSTYDHDRDESPTFSCGGKLICKTNGIQSWNCAPV